MEVNYNSITAHKLVTYTKFPLKIIEKYLDIQ